MKVNVFARVTPLHTCFNSTYMYSLHTIVSETDVRPKAYFRFQIFSLRVCVISEKISLTSRDCFVSNAQFYSRKRIVIFCTSTIFVEIICDFYLRLTIYVLIVIYLLFLNCTICILQFYCVVHCTILIVWTHEM